MKDAAGFLNGPTAVAQLPIAVDLDQVNRVRAAMGKVAVDVEVIGRPEYGDVVCNQQSGVPIAFRELFRPPIGRVKVPGLRPGA